MVPLQNPKPFTIFQLHICLKLLLYLARTGLECLLLELQTRGLVLFRPLLLTPTPSQAGFVCRGLTVLEPAEIQGVHHHAQQQP